MFWCVFGVFWSVSGILGFGVWCFSIVLCCVKLYCVLLYCAAGLWCGVLCCIHHLALQASLKFQKAEYLLKSPPRGNQVDGLPRAASFEKNHEKIMFPKSIQDQSGIVAGFPAHQQYSFGHSAKHSPLLSTLWLTSG